LNCIVRPVRWMRGGRLAGGPAFASRLGKREASAIPRTGFITFVHFTCQRRCALKDRTKENQSLGVLDVGAKSTENGLFLASVTMPFELLTPRFLYAVSLG
jgi:hypothetical protein